MVVRARKGHEAPNDDADSAYMNIVEPMQGVDFNHDSRGVAVEEVFVDTENKLVIPGGVVAAVRVDSA